jgi:predicted alpha/beta superfamily hydrolase
MLPGAIQFDMKSRITGRTYRIYVAAPSGPPPHKGYPAIYLLDASTAFATVASQATVAQSEGRPSMLIVGIGYPDDGATVLLRRRDLTPSEPTGQSRAQMVRDYGPIKPGDYGGAAAFHRFMMEELRPRITALYRVDLHNQSLMGYSFGGLFVLHVLFEQPDAYRTFVAGSPSIWWNDREVLQGEAGFVAEVRAGKSAPRILITSNEWEQFEGAPGLPPAVLEHMKASRMVDNARELESRLQAIKGSGGYGVRYFLFSQETHVSGMPAAASRGLAFISRP